MYKSRNLIFLFFVLAIVFLFQQLVFAEEVTERAIMRLSPEEIHASQIKKKKILRSLSQELSLPRGNLNLMDGFYKIDAIRDQKSCGNCWVWGSTTLLEFAYLKKYKRNIQLSIQQINSLYNNGGTNGSYFACYGGLFSEYVALLNSNSRVVIPWSNTNAEFVDGNGGRLCSENLHGHCSNRDIKDISHDPYLELENITILTIDNINVSQETVINNIKKELNAGNAVGLALYLTDWEEFETMWSSKGDSYLFDITQYDQTFWGSNSGGHALVIVGYNDLSLNPDEHYWLVLNSWGVNSNHPKGTFKLKMNIDYKTSYFYYSNNTVGELTAMDFFTFNVAFPDEDPFATPTELPTETPIPTPNETPTPSLNQSSLYVYLLDNNNSGVENVSVTLNNKITRLTNSSGYVTFNELKLDEEFFVAFKKAGYKFTPSEYSGIATKKENYLSVLVESDNAYQGCLATEVDKQSVKKPITKIYDYTRKIMKSVKNYDSPKKIKSLRSNLRKEYSNFEIILNQYEDVVFSCENNPRCTETSYIDLKSNINKRAKKVRRLSLKALKLNKKISLLVKNKKKKNINKLYKKSFEELNKIKTETYVCL